MRPIDPHSAMVVSMNCSGARLNTSVLILCGPGAFFLLSLHNAVCIDERSVGDGLNSYTRNAGLLLGWAAGWS